MYNLCQWQKHTESNNSVTYPIAFQNIYSIIGMSGTGKSVSYTSPLETSFDSINILYANIWAIIQGKSYSINGYYIMIGQ